jgi:GNAT superfamily N-acetyltransferase
MSYSTIDITEVTPAEYPLIAVLRDSIFGEFKHRFSASFAEQIEGRRDVLALIAHLEGNPVAYKVGYQDRPRRYYSWTGGVLRDYRGQGIAKRMQDWQHAWLRARGYQSVSFNTFNKFRPMLRLGLATGFLPVGVDLRAENEMSIQFVKDLAAPDPPPREKHPPATAVHIESVSPNFHGLVARLANASGTQASPTTEADVDREVARPGGVALVAFVGDQPVGFAIGHADADEPGVFVSRGGGVVPAERGRGIGVALLGRLAGAAAAGCVVLRSRARNDDAPTLCAHLKRGFDVVGMVFDARRGAASVLLEMSLASEKPDRPVIG